MSNYQARTTQESSYTWENILRVVKEERIQARRCNGCNGEDQKWRCNGCNGEDQKWGAI